MDCMVWKAHVKFSRVWCHPYQVACWLFWVLEKGEGYWRKKCLFQSLKFQFLFLLLALLVGFLFVSLHNILLSLQRCYHWFLSICLGHNAGNSSSLSGSTTFYNLANGIFSSHCFRFWQHTVLYIFLHSKFLCCPRFPFFSPLFNLHEPERILEARRNSIIK